LAEERVLDLGGKVAAVAVGGEGRFLLLTLADRKELAIFDAFRQSITARVPLAADDVLVAAGADVALLVYPGLRFIHRWDLRRGVLDRTAALPVRGEVLAVALGSGSTGPMLVHWAEMAGVGAFNRGNFSFIDPASLKVLVCTRLESNGGGELPQAGVVVLPRFRAEGEQLDHRTLPGMVRTTFSYRIPYEPLATKLRASPRGDVFALWQSGIRPAGFCTLAIRGRTVRHSDQHEDAGHLIPGHDGRTVFTGTGGRRDLQARPLDATKPEPPKLPQPPGPQPRQRPPTPPQLVPSAEPAFFMAIEWPNPPPNRPDDRKAIIAFHALGLDRKSGPLGSVDVPWEFPKPPTPPTPPRPLPPQAPAARAPEIDQRFHWFPAADLLAVIPPTNNRLLLRRVRVDALLEGLRDDDLLLVGPRAADVVLGLPFRRALEARSGRGRPEFVLVKGPDGMRLSPAGELNWDEPVGRAGEEAEVEVAIRDAAGRSIHETIILRLLAAGEAER
jgi:hypothetical protein